MLSSGTSRLFYPVLVHQAAEEVVEQIAFAIRSGAIKAGDWLPYIDELSKVMQVSKPVIGDALKILARAGIVETRRGLNGGTYVVRNEIQKRLVRETPQWQHLTLEEIFRARRPIEIEIATLAAAHATQEYLEDIESQIELLRKHSTSLHSRIHHDHMFHYAMARAAGNALLARFQHDLLEQIYLRVCRRKEYLDTYIDVELIVSLHQETLQALRSGDEAQVKLAMDHHLRPMEDLVCGRTSSSVSTR
jgi:DNA-binding FadR family transcriptional regulator